MNKDVRKNFEDVSHHNTGKLLISASKNQKQWPAERSACDAFNLSQRGDNSLKYNDAMQFAKEKKGPSQKMI